MYHEQTHEMGEIQLPTVQTVGNPKNLFFVNSTLPKSPL